MTTKATTDEVLFEGAHVSASRWHADIVTDANDCLYIYSRCMRERYRALELDQPVPFCRRDTEGQSRRKIWLMISLRSFSLFLSITRIVVLARKHVNVMTLRGRRSMCIGHGAKDGTDTRESVVSQKGSKLTAFARSNKVPISGEKNRNRGREREKRAESSVVGVTRHERCL